MDIKHRNIPVPGQTAKTAPPIVDDTDSMEDKSQVSIVSLHYDYTTLTLTAKIY